MFRAMIRRSLDRLRHRHTAGVTAVAATWIYFLLFAQFGFLHLLDERLPESARQGVMASMGLAGLATSLLVASFWRRLEPGRWLGLGFAGSGGAALAALLAHTPFAFGVVAAAIGAGAATLTVALAADLRHRLEPTSLGSMVGLGTGLGYLVCNLPPLFAGSAEVQTLAAAMVCLVGLLASRAPRHSTDARHGAFDRGDFRGLGFISLALAFLALIWLDSAAFAVIQESRQLKGLTWQGPGRQLLLGTVHLVAAVMAGWRIDRGNFRGLLLLTFGLFLTGFTLLQYGGALAALGGPIYAIGISIYSTALVVVPSAWPDGDPEERLIGRRWRAAWVFGVAGWLGSALGIGMAQDLHRVPAAFLVASGAILLAGWGLAHRRSLAPLWRLARTHRATLGVALVGSTLAFGPGHGGTATPSTAREPVAAGETDPGRAAIRRGRQVYVAEGCIHCHSQYVRPVDVDRFGPARGLDRQEYPPLPGNRRQGPDLSHVGNRRSRTWHELHLRSPRTLSPGSRMPSYDHLFRQGQRGDDLVSYLASLGQDDAEAWWHSTREHRFGAEIATGSAERGQPLFQSLCSPCHGTGGRGDGPLAEALGPRRALDLGKGSFYLVSWGPGADEPLDPALARVIRFGLPGTSMPGHEALEEDQLADLVAFVRQLAGVGV